MKNDNGSKQARREISRLEFCRTLTTGGLMITGLVSTAGCGGGSSTGTSGGSGTGRAAFTVDWPEQTRLIPYASNSIVISITQSFSGPVVASQTLARPDGGGMATASFENLRPGGVYVSAAAYPNADGTGTAQASAFSSSVFIQAGKTATLSLTMDSTIDRLEMTPSTITLFVGDSVPLPLTAKNIKGEIVLIDPTKLNYTYFYTQNDGGMDTSGVAIVDSTGKLAAKNAGIGAVNVTDPESGKKTKATVIVSPPADKPISQKSVTSQITPSHSRRASFDQTIYFPNLPIWSAPSSVGGVPIIADGRVFATETNGSDWGISAFNRATGKRLWGIGSDSLENLEPMTLTYDDGILIAGGTFKLQSSPCLIGIDPATGSIRWRFRPSTSWIGWTSPVAANGMVYFSYFTYNTGGQGYILRQVALSSAGGSLRWEHTSVIAASSLRLTPAETPVAVVEDGLVCFMRSGQLDMRDAATGGLVWQSDPSQPIQHRFYPIAHKGKLYTRGTTSTGAYILDPPVLDLRTGSQSGTYRWSPYAGGSLGSASPAFAENLCLQATTTGMLAVDTTTQQTVWTSSIKSEISPIFIDNTAIAIDNDGYVRAFEGATGKVLWKSGYIGKTSLGITAGEGYLIAAITNSGYPAGLFTFHMAGPK